MKRKIDKPINKNAGLARMLSEKVDEYLDSLVTNEDEIASIVGELSRRNLNAKQIESINKSYKVYEDSAKELTDYINKR